MGQEVRCVARVDGQPAEGRALLETDELLFRGTPRVRIPFSSIRSVETVDGWLKVVHAEGEASFELGPAAAKWAERIRSPKSVLDKLGVKPEHRVALVGTLDAGFRKQLSERAAAVLDGLPEEPVDLLFLAADTRDALRLLLAAAERIVRSGAVWVIRPKGRPEITEAEVMAAGKAAGMVDVKVVRFSETHTAEKLVIPVARR